jgi:glyoxylase-like metal-dependent hydrolase (beta-lactamase superfamily II)
MPLPGSGTQYSSNVYLVLGRWSRLSDVNALVDVGRDPYIFHSLRQAPTGVGKNKLDRVVLTHSHYDHAELLPRVRAEFRPRVLALSAAVEGVDQVLADGDRIILGDEEFEVIAIRAHSSDSICLCNDRTGTVFSGDAPLIVAPGANSYEPAFLAAMERLCARDVRIIYPGHGEPLNTNCNLKLRASLDLIRVGVGTNREPRIHHDLV